MCDTFADYGFAAMPIKPPAAGTYNGLVLETNEPARRVCEGGEGLVCRIHVATMRAS
jgi:hypothetical protein